ncbi:MAG: redoxin domain-containing protein [Myxococcota bacterium]
MRYAWLAGVVTGVILSLVPSFAESPSAESARSNYVFPNTLVDVDGRKLDVAALVKRHTVVVVTLKATWCPVCRRQLARLKELLPELEPCGVSFLVLAPGPAEELREIKKRTRFPYPFVEDAGLGIARGLGLLLNEREIMPAIFSLSPDRTVGWMQRGRSGRYFGDPELLQKLACWTSI